MTRVRALLLATLALAASCPPAFASTGPVGPPGVSPHAAVLDTRDAHGSAARDGSDSAWPLAIFSSAFAAVLVLALHRLPRRRRAPEAVAAREPTFDPAPLPEPLWTEAAPASLAPDPPELLPSPPSRRGRESPVRDSHIALYDAEYAQQLVRVQRLRETVSAFVALGGTTPAANGAGPEPKPEGG